MGYHCRWSGILLELSKSPFGQILLRTCMHKGTYIQGVKWDKHADPQMRQRCGNSKVQTDVIICETVSPVFFVWKIRSITMWHTNDK